MGTGKEKAVTQNDSWDVLRKEMQIGSNSIRGEQAKAAFEIKVAMNTAKYSHRMVIATCVLAVFTIVLCFFALLSYIGSNRQADAINALAKATQEQVAATQELNKTVSLIPIRLRFLEDPKHKIERERQQLRKR